MTLKELSQLHYLRGEIAQERERIIRLREMATATTTLMNGMPRAGTIADKPAIAAQIADCERMIEAKLSESVVVYHRLTDYINSIDDSLTRQIFAARFIDGLQWEKVADKCGGSAASAKMTVYRFIRKS